MKNQDLNQLYLEHQNSLRKIAYKYLKAGQFYGYDFDDLMSLQHLGFMKAVDTYKEDKGVKFNTFLMIVAEQKIQEEFRNLRDSQKRKANTMTVSLNYEVEGKDGNKNEIPLPELILENPYEEIEFKELLNKVNTLISHRKGAKTILKMKLQGYSNQEIANKLGIGERAMAKRYSDLKIYLKKHLKIEHYKI